ncbi:MAG: hypothetical protein ACREPV_04595 [Lysobacter sp.]
MDRQDAKPSRPSLLAGAQPDTAPAPSSARILADMQGRESGAHAGARATPKRWLAPAALLLVAVAAAGWWWQSQPAADAPANALPRLSLQADAGSDADGPALPAAATIVEEAAPAAIALATAETGGGNGELADPAVNPMLVMARPDAPAQAVTTSPDGAPNPFLVAAAPTRAAAKSAAPRRSQARAAVGDEPDLLAILLGNIKPGQSSGKDDGSGLDAFIQTMEAEDSGVASADRNRNGRPQRTRSQQIQQNLRECPAANTAKGVKCRQEICAVYAGRDPACPANG